MNIETCYLFPKYQKERESKMRALLQELTIFYANLKNQLHLPIPPSFSRYTYQKHQRAIQRQLKIWTDRQRVFTFQIAERHLSVTRTHTIKKYDVEITTHASFLNLLYSQLKKAKRISIDKINQLTTFMNQNLYLLLTQPDMTSHWLNIWLNELLNLFPQKEERLISIEEAHFHAGTFTILFYDKQQKTYIHPQNLYAIDPVDHQSILFQLELMTIFLDALSGVKEELRSGFMYAKQDEHDSLKNMA